MVTNENLSLINTFTGGMNSDLSLLMIGEGQYTYGENIRIHSYNTVGESSPSNQHGEVRPIDGIVKCTDWIYRIYEPSAGKYKEHDQDFIPVSKILAYKTIREYGVVIIESPDGSWAILRIKNTDHDIQYVDVVFHATSDYRLGGLNGVDKVSIDCIYEDGDDNIKVYIADGDKPMMIINIHESQDIYNANLNGNAELLYSYPKANLSAPVLTEYTSGKLKPALIQYSYRLYNKNGVATDMSPLSKQFPVVKTSDTTFEDAKKVVGVLQNKESNVGLHISVNIGSIVNYYGYIQVYRITYVQNGQLPTVDMILELKVSEKDFDFIDSGLPALSSISVEEYNSYTQYKIIPKVIESKDNMLFAANIKHMDNVFDEDWFKNWDARAYQFDHDGNVYLWEYKDKDGDSPAFSRRSIDSDVFSGVDGSTRDCFNRFNDMSIELCDMPNTIGYGCRYNLQGNYGGTGPNIEWSFIVAKLPADTCVSDIPYGSSANCIKSKNDINGNKILPKYFVIHEDGSWLSFPNQHIPDTYGNLPHTAANVYNQVHIKSLHRGELYRYGIVFRDRSGNVSPVKWIADIRVPNLYVKGFLTFESNDNIIIDEQSKYIDLSTNSIGILFTVKNLPEQIASYEIVRCNRTIDDSSIISQGVLSRPIRKYFNTRADDDNHANEDGNYPLTPTGLLTTCDFSEGFACCNDFHTDNTAYLWNEANNLENKNTFLFISPEVAFQKDDFVDVTKNATDIVSQTYLFGSATRTNSDYDNDVYVIPKVSSTGNHFFAESKQLFIRPCFSGLNMFIDIDTGKPEMRRFGITNPKQYLIEEYYKIKPTTDDVCSTSKPTYRYNEATDMISVNDDLNWPDLKKNVYAYVKLYQQPWYIEYPAVFRSRYLLSEYPEVASAVNTYRIGDLQVAEDCDWNDTVDKVDSGYSLKYIQKKTTVGTEEFCNWVSGSAYNINPINENGYNNMRNSSDEDYIFGPGGRCALIQIDTDDESLFSTTLASYGRLQNQDARDYTDVNTFPNYIFDYLNHRYPIFRESILGTYLCNIKKNCIPYGGQTYAAICNSVYYGHGFVNSTFVFDGDTYVYPFEYTSMHKAYDGNDKGTLFSTAIMYAIPVETTINLANTSGVEMSREMSSNASNLQMEPSDVYNVYVQQKPAYEYNTAYSLQSTLTPMSAYNPDELEYNKKLDYRCYHSELKSNDERIDSWSIFKPANFIDVDTRYGEITHLRTFHNNLIFWQDGAVGVLSVNERSTTTDEQGMPLLLGVGDVLGRYDYIDNTSGMSREEFCDALSDSGLYWFDDKNNEIKKYAGGLQVVQLTKSCGVLNLMFWLKSNINHNMFYDRKYNDIVSDVINKPIVYSEMINKFTTLTGIPFDGSLSFYDDIYLLKNKDSVLNIAKWNERAEDHPRGWENEILAAKISYVVNKLSSITKVFDNQEIVTVNKRPDGLEGLIYGKNVPDTIDTSSYFSKHHRYTWSTDLNNTESTLENNITLREGNYRFAIPRQDNAEYGNRIRGKYMLCSIEDNEPIHDSSISYIITKFRLSW